MKWLKKILRKKENPTRELQGKGHPFYPCSAEDKSVFYIRRPIKYLGFKWRDLPNVKDNSPYERP